MNLSKETYETIEAYLQGALSASNTVEFEQRLKSEPDLAEHVQIIREMDIALSDRPALNFQKIVQEEGDLYLNKNTSKEISDKAPRGYWTYFALIAALVVVIAGALIYKNMFPSPASGEELFAQYYEPYSLNQSVRSEVNLKSELNTGITQYQTKDFALAINTFKGLIQSNGQDNTLAFYLANAYMNLNPPNIDLAEQQFQKTIQDGSNIYVPQSKWYAALILLKKDKIDEAKVLLHSLSESQNQLGQKAKNLLKELE